MKMLHLKNIESVLPKLLNTDLPLKYSYLLNVIMNDVGKHMVGLHNFRVDFMNKYGEKTKEGTIRIDKDKIKEFDDGMEELLQEEIELKATEIPLSILMETDIKITALEVESLKSAGFLVDDINTIEE